ncbi:MAG: hypothetical protein RTU30_06225 [Candidatus Thorarchaeota archaeon]
MLKTIIDLLRRTKESEVLYSVSESDESVLIDFNLTPEVEGSWSLDRRTRIELAMAAISKGAETEAVVGHLTWKDFEGFVANVLEEHNFRCTESYRRKGNSNIRGMEIDVIGVRGSTILSVDAKMWGTRKNKSSAIKSAAEKQIVRTVRLCHEISRLSKKIGEIKPGLYKMVPLIVTWFIEDVEFHDGVPILPLIKFNSFILDLDSYEEMIVTLDCEITQ